MIEEDVPQVTIMLNNYLSARRVRIQFNEEEVRHFFLPREEVIYTYVDCTDNQVTDVFSFYYLPSQILNHPKHRLLKVAYSFYNVSNTGRFKAGMIELLRKAKEMEMDVFNALDVMENKDVFEELKFGIGDGQLYFYLYNWRMKDVKPEQVGIVLV